MKMAYGLLPKHVWAFTPNTVQVFYKNNQQMHLWLLINHTYIFRSPSATIFRVYIIKMYNKKCGESVQDLGS
jgi:hypothetical protein